MFEKGNKAAVGNKGRRPWVDEAVKRAVLTQSWDRIHKRFGILNPSALDKEFLDKVSLELVKKTAPQDIDISSDGKPFFLPIEILKKNNIKTEEPK